MTREEGLKQIDEARWKVDKYSLDLYVNDSTGRTVHCWLNARPHYCDRGHVQFNLNGIGDLDGADSFPRYFFSFAEADAHVRTFLKWRLWKERTAIHDWPKEQTDV